jgi:hypothetical protein
MKRLALVAIVVVSFAAYAVADQINFNYTIGGPGSVTATNGGLTAGPAMLTSISDTTTGVNILFSGTFVTATTGAALSLVPIGSPPTLIVGTFDAGGPNSVQVVDSLSNPLVTGAMQVNSTFASSLPGGTGSYMGSFDVAFVSPAALALFGLGPAFQPVGSVAYTFGNANWDGTTFTAAIGGGSVTIQTPTATPEPAGLAIVGVGLLTIVGGLRRWRSGSPN